MAGYLGSLNSFHSLEKIKTVLRAHPPVLLMLLLGPRRNVYHMEKQSPQRFTTGILTQQETQRRRVRGIEGKEEAGEARRWKEKAEEERRSGAQKPEAGKVVYVQKERCVAGGRRGWRGGGRNGRAARKEERKVEVKLMGGEEVRGGALECSSIIILIEINFKYSRI